MPRAFLIKSRAACPAPKKETIEEENSLHENAQAAEVTSNFMQDTTCVTSTSSPAQISSPNEVVKKSYPLNSPVEHVRSEIEDRKPSQTATDFTRYSNRNITEVLRTRKRPKASYQLDEYEHEKLLKKVRKSQSKKSVVHFYKDDNVNERNDSHTQRKDEPRFGNYTVERSHYANEPMRYHRRELAIQSHDKSSGKMYSDQHGKQTQSFAYQNNGESLNQGKHSPTQRHSENKDLSDENTGLENVMIVEYHSVKANRRPSYREESNPARPCVTQHSSRGYSYSPPQSSPVTTSNYVPASPVTTSTAPIQQALPPRISAQPMPTQESVKSTEQEPKVVYVPVYPVSQGPNGVIYEPIPNATPIMAKDALPVQKVQQPREQPRIIQAVAPQRQEVVMTSPPPQAEHKPRVEYRHYEPQIPQQLTATPAPRAYQPHPQGHVIIQQPQSAPATPTSYGVAQVPQYTVRPAPPQPPHQYQQQQSQQQSPPQPSQHYQPQAPAPQTVVYRPAAPQNYKEQPHHLYPRHATMPGYHERVIVQPVHGPHRPPVAIQQPIYHHQERPSHAQQPARPPPLPSQPQHAEKPALPSPSYPKESANRLLTPRYTPDGPKHEHKFVYAPPPADFMNSPVYRVPNNDKNAPIYHHDKAERNHYKTGSRKRKPSYPSHAVLPSKIEHQGNLPSPANSNSRTPSPKETDLRCNERLVKSPHQPSSLNKSSLVMTPPVSPNDRAENTDTVTVVVRDQGIQASPRGERALEHTCFRNPANHDRNNSYQSDSSEDEYMDDDSVKRSDSEDRQSYENSPDSDMYTEDGTLVVRIPHPDDNSNDTAIHPKRQRNKKSNFRFMCKFCNKGFQWHSHLESHERTHTGEKPFKCPECDRAFCRADGLQCHMLVHNKKRPYKCPHCGKGFTDKIVLEKHIYSHTGVKPFKCEYCGRAFSDSLSIEKHLLVHTGTKPYKCPYCVRSFNDSQMLVRHIRSHTGEKPFKCKHCPMAFSKQSALIIHTRVHTGEKPYKCPHCIKSFSISGNLQRHILIHTGERPYKCSKCPKAFNNPSHLSRHISKLHAPQNGTMKQPVKQFERYSKDQPVMKTY